MNTLYPTRSALTLLAVISVSAGCALMSTQSNDNNNDNNNNNAQTSVACQNGVDEDGDGYGVGCAMGTDCDDEAPATHPGAGEVCNGIDDDCDGAIDEELACLIEICTEPGGTPEDEDRDGSIDEGCPCEDGTTRECCGTGLQACVEDVNEFGGQWGECSESCIGCDELPPNLGGYRIVFDPNSSVWIVRTDGNGNPILDNSQSDPTRSCTLLSERVESGQASTLSLPASTREVFFQIVGGGGGGGRYFEPPISGGGAGGYATGIVDVSAATAPVQFSASAGLGGGTVDPTCSEDACNFTCVCLRGSGEPGTDSTLTVDGIVITGAGGTEGTCGVSAPGGEYGVQGSSTSVVVQLDTDLSAPGNAGQPGPHKGFSGPGGSPACNWGTGAGGNQSGIGYGAGGGGGNNSPAGVGSGGLAILMWVECS